MSKWITGLMLIAFLTVAFTGPAQAAKETRKTASDTTSVKSWAGVTVVSLSVKGYYYTNGTKITKYAGTSPFVRKCNGCFLYKITSPKSSWIAKGKTEGVVQATAWVEVGIPTPWGTVAWDEYTLEVEAFAEA